MNVHSNEAGSTVCHVVGLLLWALFPACGSALVEAQDYCSLVVRVVSPDRRLPVSVSVVEKNGRTEEREPTSGDVRFCDLGGLPVTVKVGDDGTCNQVIVREVPVAWRQPYVLKITYDPTPCNIDLPPPPLPVCRVVIRVADSRGWAQGARVRALQPTPAELQTDRFGRASLVTKLGDDVRGSVTAGSLTADFAFKCSRDEPIHEELIVLRPQ